MPVQLLAIVTSLAAAAAWGAADFGGGVASRKLDSLRVVILAQLIGLVALLVIASVSGEALPAMSGAGLALVAGIAGGIGLVMLYEALAIGPMGVIAPLTAAISGIIPAAVGIALEGWPGTIRFSGFILAIVAAWVVASPGDHRSPPRRALVLSILAGLSFAIFLTAIARNGSSGTYWPLTVTRVASISSLCAILLWRTIRTQVQVDAGAVTTRFATPWFFITLAGLGDTAGNIFFVAATQIGRLDVAAVVSSLYPAGTVLLAWVFLGERLSGRQIAGVLLALIAIAMIAI